MAAINSVMNEKLQKELELQLSDLHSDNKLEDEFKQFYTTLANFNS